MKEIGIVIVLAMALFSVPAFAQTAIAGTNMDVLAQGIFEADGSAVQIPNGDCANLDGVIVGNDRALAFGTPWGFTQPRPIAQNNLEIKKNQQADPNSPLINAEQVKVGDRTALAFGSGTAQNNIKIVTNQMGYPSTATAGAA